MRPAMGAAGDRLSPRQKSWMMAGTVALISLAAGYGLSQLGEGQGGASDAGDEDWRYGTLRLDMKPDGMRGG